MKKIYLILVLIILPYYDCSEISAKTYIEGNDNLTSEQVINDIDTIKTKMDTTFSVGYQIIGILSNDIKQYGLKKAIKIHSSFFVPIFIFLALYLLWLKNNRK